MDKVCGYRGHETHWYTRPDGTMSCDVCHPHGDAAERAVAELALRSPPRYHVKPPFEEAKAKRTRKRQIDEGGHQDAEGW